MKLYPAIDIIKGQAVRLVQGDYDKETVYDSDPVAVAKRWEEAGAEYIHVVDLDGALNGQWANSHVISAIADEVNIPVQTGGGIRTIDDIEERLHAGVARVIIGTLAVKEPETVAHAVAKFGSDKIVVGIDAKNGKVAIHGWEEVSEVSAVDLCMSMKRLGVKTIVYTDISKDGMMQGPNVEQTKHLTEATGLEIIASGGVSRYDDVTNLKDAGVQGAIIGKALYTKDIDLVKALELSREDA